jgi:hypothetical protein
MGTRCDGFRHLADGCGTDSLANANFRPPAYVFGVGKIIISRRDNPSELAAITKEKTAPPAGYSSGQKKFLSTTN